MIRIVFFLICGFLFLNSEVEAQRRGSSQRKTILPAKKKAPTTPRNQPVAKPDSSAQIRPVSQPATDTIPATDTTSTDTDPAVQGDTLTEKAAEELLEKTAPKADSIRAYKITIEDISHLSVCPGTTITIPFTTDGPFDADNTYIAQIIDPSGKTVPISLPVKKSPIKAVVPSYKIGGELYRIQIVSTIPIVRSQEVPIRLLQVPTARVDLLDGSQSVRTMPGQDVNLRVHLSGAAPWAFRMSDSTVVYQTMSNPHFLTVRPNDVKAYKVTAVSNACGSGTVSGEVIANVNANPEPKLELKEVEKIAKLCSGVPFQVPFNATGKFRDGNRFQVQISERTGSFKTISSPDSTGLVTAEIPSTYKPGEYKLRVVSSAPYLVSQTTNVSIVAAATAVLQKDSLRLGENETGELTLKFSGGGPWFVLLSDGTYENNIIESPYKLKVKPTYDTQYQITSAGGLCGVGKFSGSAKVSVKSAPASITLDKLAQNMACAGATLDIPYKSEGRYNQGNKFVVQITDKSGRFVSLPTTVSPTSMKVKLPSATPVDSVRTLKIRIISSSPAVSSAIQELGIIAPDKAVGEVSGRATIASGRTTRIQLKFKNGLPPWSFTLSDGTAINGTFLNPYLISVSPASTTDYTISSLKSGCGNGTGKGSATVTVEN